MASIFLALFLIVFGLNLLLGLSIPIWVSGLLALIAGILLLMRRFNVSFEQRGSDTKAPAARAGANVSQKVDARIREPGFFTD
jgi:hypothetical protein